MFSVLRDRLALLLRRRYSVRTLFFVVTFCAIVFGLIGLHIRASLVQRDAVAELTEKGGQVTYFHELDDWGHIIEHKVNVSHFHPYRAFVARMFGDDFASSVGLVSFANSNVADEDVDHIVQHLQALPELAVVWLNDTRLSDDALDRIDQALPDCSVQR